MTEFGQERKKRFSAGHHFLITLIEITKMAGGGGHLVCDPDTNERKKENTKIKKKTLPGVWPGGGGGGATVQPTKGNNGIIFKKTLGLSQLNQWKEKK